MSISRIEFIIKQAAGNKSLQRKLRSNYLEELLKIAQTGILQNYQSGGHSYDTRKDVLTHRGGDKPEDTLYGVKPADSKEFKDSIDEPAHSLSTRYVPDKPGVQVQRVKGTDGGVYMDPYTNRIYDWNQGFKTEDGREFPASGVDLQTDMYSNVSESGNKIKKTS